MSKSIPLTVSLADFDFKPGDLLFVEEPDGCRFAVLYREHMPVGDSVYYFWLAGEQVRRIDQRFYNFHLDKSQIIAVPKTRDEKHLMFLKELEGSISQITNRLKLQTD